MHTYKKGKKFSTLKVVFLSEIIEEDSASHFAIRTDPKCWGISNLDTKISYLPFDRMVKRTQELNLDIIPCLSEVSLHELIHQAMRYDYPKVNNETYVYAFTYILLASFHLDHVKVRIKDIFKSAPRFEIGSLFKRLAESVIDV